MIRILSQLVACLFFLSLGSACATIGGFRNGVYSGHGVSYRIGEPGAGWSRAKLREADIAWIYENGSASLLVNSRCIGSKDVPLEALSGELLIGMTEQKRLSASRDERSNREGLEITTSAKLDGVQLTLRSYVLKRDLCVYDIVLAASPDSFENALVGYQAVTSLFDVEGPQID